MRSSDSKTLLVLGASYYQCEAIRTAQRVGYRVVAVDYFPDSPGHSLADASYVTSTTNREEVLELARRESVDGVIAFATDVAVPTQAYVADALGLAGPPLAAANATTDKVAFQEVATRAGIPALPALVLGADDQPDPTFFEGGPVVLRPDRSSGSKGCFIVRTASEYRARAQRSMRFAGGGRVLLQPYVAGRQGTIEGVFDGGAFPVVFFTDRSTAEDPYVATLGHAVPSSLDDGLVQRALELIRRVWLALGVEATPFDCDFVATEEEVFLLELTPRLGGNSICRMIREASGVDLLDYAVRAACGDVAELPEAPTVRPTAVTLLGVSDHGLLHFDEEALARLTDEPWVRGLEIDLPLGAAVEPFRQGRHRVGEAIVRAESRSELDMRMVELRRRLDLGVRPARRP